MQLPTNSGSSVMSALPQLIQLFTGSGKQTGTKTTTSSKTASGSSISALESILGQSAPNTDAAVKNALDLMFRQGMPSIGSAERGSGIFNSSATKENVNQLSATAAAKAAELDLNQQNKATDQKLAAAGTLGQLTSQDTVTQTGSEKTGGVIDPMMGALGLAGAVGLNYLMGTGTNKKQAGQDATGPSADANLGFTPVIKQPSINDAFSNVSFSGIVNDTAAGMKAATTNPITGEQVTGGGNDLLGVLSDVGAQIATSAVGDFIGGLFSGGSSSGESSISGPVLCTKLYQLGLLSDELYAADLRYSTKVAAANSGLREWYQSWAMPLVPVLDNKIGLLVMKPFITAWAKHMAFMDGTISQDSKLGRLLLWLGLKAFAASKLVTDKGGIQWQV